MTGAKRTNECGKDANSVERERGVMSQSVQLNEALLGEARIRKKSGVSFYVLCSECRVKSFDRVLCGMFNRVVPDRIIRKNEATTNKRRERKVELELDADLVAPTNSLSALVEETSVVLVVAFDNAWTPDGGGEREDVRGAHRLVKAIGDEGERISGR